MLILSLLTGCAGGTFADWVYRDSQTAYRVGPLPAGWERVDLKGGNVAFRHGSGGSILANGLCTGVKDVPLDVLTNQALFGLEQKQEMSRETFTLDGRAAERTRLTGALDGVPVELELVVLKKDNCTYDLQLVAAPGAPFDARVADFDAFVAGFHELGTSG
jgi:hypothetical protein